MDTARTMPLAEFQAVQTACEQARAALRKLVRKGGDGRWYTTQHGDADVTAIVSGVLR